MNQETKKRWLKFYVIMFIIIGVLSFMIVLVAPNQDNQQGQTTMIKTQCYNAEEVIESLQETNQTFRLIKEDMKAGQYNCTLFRI